MKIPNAIISGPSMDPVQAKHHLSYLWAQVLGVSIGNIDEHSHFLNLGGGSVAAVNLAETAKKAGMSLTVADIFQYPILSDQVAVLMMKSNQEEDVRQPQTERERKLKALWAQSLEIDDEEFGIDDNFFDLGGDSIVAVKLVAAAREAGLILSASYIFQCPTIASQARGNSSMPSVEALRPFSLLGGTSDLDSLRKDIAELCSTHASSIEDAYPCTPLQEGLLSLSAGHTGDYAMRFTLELGENVPLELFKEAWQKTVTVASILRTRIVHHSQYGLMQAIVKENIEWIEAVGLQQYLQIDRKQPMPLGHRLSRYAIVKDDETLRPRWFVWTVHRSLYDEWSIPLILDAAERTYSGETLASMPGFQLFIKYLTTQNEAETIDYWKKTMAGCESAQFPLVPPSVRQLMTDHTIVEQLPIKQKSLSITASSLVQAAWGLVASRMTNSDDVIFGMAVSGRNAHIPYIDMMAGPTTATVPLRIKLAKDQQVLEYLTAVQNQAAEMIPFEQTGLQKIAQISADCQQACAFQTLLVIQPPRKSNHLETKLGRWSHSEQKPQRLDSYALVLNVDLGKETIEATAEFDSRVLEPWLVRRLLARLKFVMQQLNAASPQQKLWEISTMTPHDLNWIWDFNKDIPTPAEEFVHDIVAKVVQAQPEAPAVCAWDGDLTYRELDDFSSKLARRFLDLGLTPNTIIPLCFEKSKWVPVAMLGVLKAGAAFMMLEPSLPEERLKVMVQQVGAGLILSSTSNLDVSSRLCQTTIEVSTSSMKILGHASYSRPQMSPSLALMFVVFTSGSTGTPKGALASHQNFSSAIKHQAPLFRLDKTTRVFDYASYAFDGSIYNAFMTFATGGCLCIPSDEDRKDNITKAMAAMEVTLADFTPTVARLLDPSAVPSLQTLMLSGEAVSASDAIPWCDKVRIVNGYGPAECTSLSTINDSISNAEEVTCIGKGAGLLTWVVDPENHNVLLPPGCIGELLLEGPLVGLGYVNEPQKTASVFIQDPSWLLRGAPGQQGRHGLLYKTGDLVRYNENGSLTYFGRKDAQVKLRGQRLELGDVEHWVQKCVPQARHAIAETIVLQREDSSHTLLAAFLELGGSGQKEDLESVAAEILVVDAAIQDELAEHLPSYMIPTVFFSIQKLPLTTSGKVDRKALRTLGSSFSYQELYGAKTTRDDGLRRQPTTQTERQIQEIWARVLNINLDMIGLDDSFIHLGGESIAAMKIAGEARKMGLRLSVADMFRHPRLHSMSQRATPLSKDCSSLIAIPHTEYSGPVVQSFAQARLWFMEQLYSSRDWYHLPWTLRFRGRLRIEALKAALLSIERRHEILRTKYLSRDGTNLQWVTPFEPRELEVVDLLGDEEALLQALSHVQTRPFNLETETGWRVSIYRMKENDYVLSMVMHHIISDGWSVDILAKELATFYSASIHGRDLETSMQPLPIQYRDYSVWQHHQVGEHERQLKFWIKELDSSRPAELLPDKPRPATLSGNAGIHSIQIQGSLHRKLQEFCKIKGVTPFVTLLAAFRAMHYRLTTYTDATIGIGNANRDLWELKDMVGLFVNMQCIRTNVQSDSSFEELVRQVQSAVTASFANQDVPFDQVVSAINKGDRDLSRNPLFQIFFAVHSQKKLGDVTLEEVEAEQIIAPPTTRFDMEWHLHQEEDSLDGYINYSTDLYYPETIANMVSIFHTVLESALHEPKVEISLLPLIGNEPSMDMDSTGCLFNAHEIEYPYPGGWTVLDAFREQVTAHPHTTAVKDSSSSLTYDQLDKESDTLAHWITTRKSLSPDTLVGVYAGRSCQTIIAFLGIIKASCAYLPLDINHPIGRIETILSSVEGQKLVFLGPNTLAPPVGLDNVEFVRIQDALDEPAEKSEAIAAKPSASSLVYVSFTSGSTGKPKGVMIEHRSLVLLVKSDLANLHPPRTVCAHVSNIAFDVSAWEIWTTLLNGGTLVCIDATAVLDCAAIRDIFAREKIQSTFCTPALFKQYLAECPSTIGQLEAVFVGGEKLDPQDTFTALALMEGRGKVVNVYGPTENTVWSAFYSVPEGEMCGNGVPIGRAVSGSGIYVLDPQQYPVPIGVVGELVTVGECLARGYIDPQQNVDRFITVTIKGETMRAYRTGDYGRYRPVDGKLEYIGRIDGQVKIRGHRIELAEIEHLIKSHKLVRNAVVVVQQQQQLQGDLQDIAQLVGFITVNKEQSFDGDQEGPSSSFTAQSLSQGLKEKVIGEIYKSLKLRLPSYMIPQAIVALENMPLNVSGKVDRQALAKDIQTPTTTTVKTSKQQPITETEQKMQEIWSHVLNMNSTSIGLDDNFFELGGNSILAMRAVGMARNMAINLTVADIFHHGSLKRLSHHVDLEETLGDTMRN
ncbi:hypothetical protein GGI35DRAFT_4429 [Trichoderma velutinum]